MLEREKSRREEEVVIVQRVLMTRELAAVCIHLVKSYGATTVIMSFLTVLEKLSLQACDKWMYDKGVSRVQTRLNFRKDRLFFCGGKLDHILVVDYGKYPDYSLSKLSLIRKENCK